LYHTVHGFNIQYPQQQNPISTVFWRTIEMVSLSWTRKPATWSWKSRLHRDLPKEKFL